jgi:GT2 family glycosyltransferase
MADPVATVVIPNYNGMAYLSHLMNSLHTQSDPRLAVTVVDDTSTDESATYLASQWPQVRLIRNDRNLGFAGTCNVGLRSATTPFVALLNNDTHVDRDWLAEGLRPFDRPEVGSVASLVLLAEPPHLIDTAGDAYSVAGGALKRNHLMPRETAETLDEACFSGSGASAFYRREAVERVGYLDERFVSYYEDVDLGFRMAWAGYECAFARKSVCYHHLSSSYSPTGWRYHFNSARNAEVVWWSHMPARLRRRHMVSHFWFLGLQCLNKWRQGCLRPYLAGKWAVRREWSHILDKRRRNAMSPDADAARIESRLVRDWWRLHVSSRVGRRRRGETAR